MVYRSTKTIISAANEVIKKNKIRKEKNLFTENVDGEVITIYTGYDDRQEAQFIAKTIKSLVGTSPSPEGGGQGRGPGLSAGDAGGAHLAVHRRRAALGHRAVPWQRHRRAGAV